MIEGNTIYDFELPTDKGNLVATKHLRGKLIFIDFWASWCAPCRKQNPHLIEVYEKYKNKGLKIIGVSIDTNKDRWLKAIRD
uniref:Thioredoxin domain-containing protein n=1 Tax=Hippocampus comes TaxID=109280 RepID=A0A3Q2YWX2_HIPCM